MAGLMAVLEVALVREGAIELVRPPPFVGLHFLRNRGIVRLEPKLVKSIEPGIS
jgi:hypothetical protein